MNEAYGLTRRLRAIRSFDPSPIEAADLDAILEAARWTGSSRNSQPWQLIVLTDPQRRADLATCGRFTRPLLAAPIVVALVGSQDGSGFDTGRLAQNLMLAAAALGIGSCPVTLHDEEAARRVLGVPPDHRCRYAVALGRRAPAQPSSGLIRKGRKPVHELVHWNRFGERADPRPE